MFYFDIHPPLGKLTFWFFAKLTGYDATKCEFIDLNLPYAPECRYYILRAVSASFSTGAVALMFRAARGLGCSVLGAALAASLMIFDGLGIGEGRLILMDAQLSFWLLATLVAAQAWWARHNQDCAAAAAGVRAGRLGGAERAAWCVAIGVLCGCAIGVKMTGLVTPALVALESYLAIWTLRRPIAFRELIAVLFVSLLTYAAWFAVSFNLMTHTSELHMEEEFMTPLFQATIIGSKTHDTSGRALSDWRWQEGFWWTTVTHNARMIKHNANILAPHPWQTTWWEWVWCLRGLAYYGHDFPIAYHANVYLLGNPAVIWPAIAAVLTAAVICIVYLRYRARTPAGDDLHKFAGQAAFCLLGYFLNLLPYLGVARSTFVYHYMPALAFAQILTARVFETLTPVRYRGVVFRLALLAVVATFVYFSPWIYAFPLQPEAHVRRRWLPRWD